MKLIIAAILALAPATSALAQHIVDSCDTIPAITPGSTSPYPSYMDKAGILCTRGANATISAPIAPIVNSALANNLVVKTTPNAMLYSAYATTLTGGSSGYLLALNVNNGTVPIPADGAVAPLAWSPFSGGVAQINYANLPPGLFSVGIVLVVSSANTPYTKTTGVLTAAISALAR